MLGRLIWSFWHLKFLIQEEKYEDQRRIQRRSIVGLGDEI